MKVEEDRALPYMVRVAAPSSLLILDQEKIRMKLNECVIIKCKMMNGNQVLIGGRNMKDIV
jgi:hypothetical protein